MKNKTRKSAHTAIASLSVTAILAACNSQDNSLPPACTPASGAVAQARAQVMSNGRAISSVSGSHIPMAVSSLKDRGLMNENQALPVTIALALNNEDELNQRIAEIYQPGNPNYRRFITSQEFQDRYAPTAQQVADAQSFLVQNGIRVVSTSKSGFLIQAQAPAGALNQAFQTEVHQYAGSSQLKYAPSVDPQMPPGLSIRAVHGLETPVQLSHHAVPLAQIQKQGLGSGPRGGLSPANIRTAYNIPTSVDGSGETIALVELDGYNPADISAYDQAFGLPTTTLVNQMVSGATGTAGQNSDEVTLDIELLAAVAPKATIKVYEAPNTSQGLLALYDQIASDNNAQQVSISWGAAEDNYTISYLESESQAFRQMAIEGISVYAASGDQGADANGSKLSVEDPGTQPFVTAVGGTQLTLTTAGAYGYETTWSSAGGGISAVWPLPTWQKSLATSQNRASSSMRNVPDISLNADPSTGYSIYWNGAWTIYGGTSCATPIWAAFTALVNEQRQSSGNPTLGFTNPYLYGLTGQAYTRDFHDIGDGSNNGYYPAVSGYDDATGLGTLKGTTLFQDLTTEPAQAAASC
ncbi:MAG: S53 family serine peptidase [Oligoflexia bacterium]|nr:S53 family serine peptidase [Oligoflexia bacterium]